MTAVWIMDGSVKPIMSEFPKPKRETQKGTQDASDKQKLMTKRDYDNFDHKLMSGYWSKIVTYVLTKDKRLQERAYPMFVEAVLNYVCEARIDKQELQKCIRTIINVPLENLNKDIVATKKTKDFILYDADGSKISREEHLDKLFFAKRLFETLKEDGVIMSRRTQNDN